MKKLILSISILLYMLTATAQSTDISLNLGMALTTSNKGVAVSQGFGVGYGSCLKIVRSTKLGLTFGIGIDAMSLVTTADANTSYFGNTTTGNAKGKFVYGTPGISVNALAGYRLELNGDAIGLGLNAGYVYALSSGTNTTQRVYFENSKGATYGLYINYTHYLAGILGIGAELNPRIYTLSIPSGATTIAASLFSIPVLLGLHIKL